MSQNWSLVRTKYAAIATSDQSKREMITTFFGPQVSVGLESINAPRPYYPGVSIFCLCSCKGCAGVFSMASLATDDVKHHSEEKWKKAARAINSLDALFEEAQKRRKLPFCYRTGG
jgi:hypothetical protein